MIIPTLYRASVAKVTNGIYKTIFLMVAALVGSQVSADTSAENINRAECSARAMMLQFSIDAYTSQSSNIEVRSQSGATKYVLEKMSNQNLRKEESSKLIKRTVKYVYEILAPDGYSKNDMLEANNIYFKRCMLEPESGIGNLYVVDWDKAFSVNTDGEYLAQDKDGSLTVCSKGKCATEQLPPQDGVYEEARKAVQKLGWAPAPSAIKPILIKMGKLFTNGNKLDTNKPYGNCLNGSVMCDHSKPEFADCDESNICTAAWVKNGETIWYLVQGGMVVQYNSAPKGFIK